MPSWRITIFDCSLRTATGALKPVFSADCIVAGDVFLVMGGSNGAAFDRYGENVANPSRTGWVRTFGTASSYGMETALDLDWDLADGEAKYAHASVGAWALLVGEQLARDYQIPVAILNGCRAGARILQQYRNDADPTNLATIYGRLLFRARAAGVDQSVRAVFWYQGEVDPPSPFEYIARFRNVARDLREDYPAAERIYVAQVRDGCFDPSILIREAQRRLPELLPSGAVVTIATEGVPFHDGCHYGYWGYHDFGTKLARLVARDFYGSLDTQEIDSPNPAYAYWTSGAKTELAIVFDDPDDTVFWEAGCEQYFEFDDPSAVVVSGITGQGELLIQLAAPSASRTVSYLGHRLDGPTISNSRGVGMFSFYALPIH